MTDPPTLTNAPEVEARRAETEQAIMEGLFRGGVIGVAVLVGPDHVFTFANDAYRALVDGADVVGKPLAEALPGVGEQGFRALLDHVLATGEPYVAHEMPVRLSHHRDGELLYLSFVYSPKRGAAGEIEGVTASVWNVTEQVLARGEADTLSARLRESDARLRRVVEAAGAGLWDLDVQTGVMHGDARLYELFGLPAGSPLTLSATLAGLPVPSDATRVGAALQAAMEGKNAGRYHTEHRTGGSGGVPLRWVESRAQMSFDAAGAPLRLEGVLLDITARKLAEEEARAKTDRLALLMASTLDYAFVAMDEGGVIREWEGGAEAIIGYTAEEAIGQMAHLIFTEEDRAAGVPELELATAAKTGRAEDQRWHARKGGARFFADGVMTALHDEGGQLRGFAKVFRDRTAHQLSAIALRQSEERLRFALRAGGMGTWEMRLATREIAASDTFKTNIGRGVDESLGYADLCAAVIEEDRASFRDACEAAIRDGTELSAEMRVRWPDGSVHWLELRASSEGAGEDNAASLVGVSINVDRRKIAEEELRIADRRKDEFLLTASHELRTPLNAILGWSQLLRAGSLDAESARRAAATIERNARSQVRLIDDILDGSRMLSGKLRLEPRDVDLLALVRTSIETLRTAADARGITLAVETDRPTVALHGDPDRLQQIVWNLVGNAIKFTEPRGKVTVKVSRLRRRVQMVVADTGRGIDPAFLPYVFERFRQADGSMTRRHGGLGLGLALVAHLVEAHGGTITAQSPGIGLGATFTLELPAPSLPGEESSPRLDREARPPAVSGSLAHVRVLVVDDDQDARELVATILRLEGAIVTLASSAQEALEILARERPSLMISDIGMPDTDGHELMRRVRAGVPFAAGALPALALTAYAREEDERSALDAGFQAFLSKPLSAEALLKLVGELVPVTRP